MNEVLKYIYIAQIVSQINIHGSKKELERAEYLDNELDYIWLNFTQKQHDFLDYLLEICGPAKHFGL